MSNILHLFLDDVRNPPEDGNNWHVFRSVEHLKTFVALGAIFGLFAQADGVVFSLDHDLGEDVPTGYDFLNDIEAAFAQAGPPPGEINFEFRIHSANPVGRANMERAIASIYRIIGK